MTDADRRKTFHLFGTIGGTPVYQAKGAPAESPFFYEAGLNIDVDGAPDAYMPRGHRESLDFLGNANSKVDPTGRTGRWTSIVTNRHGTPFIQGLPASVHVDTITGVPDTHAHFTLNPSTAAQPHPGAYIATTSLHDDFYPDTDVRHYVNAVTVPYLALPPRYFKKTGLTIGDTAFVVAPKTGKYTFAIFADTKNLPNLGESSRAVADRLGVPSDLRWREHGSTPAGANSGIFYLVFPGTGLGNGWLPPDTIIQSTGPDLLSWFSRFGDRAKKLPLFFDQHPAFMRALLEAGYEKTEVGSRY
jgi:hypothetical protein